MLVHSGQRTVAIFCDELSSNKIIVNREYQRQPGIWPRDAQSFLIETILLGYPIPKLTLFEHTDLRSRATVIELVDGQQRATAIQAFFSGELTLTTLEFVEEASGCNYSTLPTELQSRFLTYSLGFDSIVNSTSAEIREIFRRMNAYEVPLNPEEHRHARYQGAFKWLVYRLAREHGESLRDIGTFTESNLVRMYEMKLIAEVVHAIDHGITTTNKRSLDNLYARYESEFPHRDSAFPRGEKLSKWFREAFDYILQLESIHRTQIIKHYSLYALLLAYFHAKHGVASLNKLAKGGSGTLPRLAAESKLTVIAEALSLDEDQSTGNKKLDRLRKAFTERTNVKSQREARFKGLFAAIAK